MKQWIARFRSSIKSLSPEHVVLLIVVGLVLGVFPIMGFPTILCLLAAVGLRLNAAALQLLNNISSPLQWALLLPLERVGAAICPDRHSGVTVWAGGLGLAALHAVVGWICICVPLGLLTYYLLVIAMRRRRQSWCNSPA
jgi:hypothetical protein